MTSFVTPVLGQLPMLVIDGRRNGVKNRTVDFSPKKREYSTI